LESESLITMLPNRGPIVTVLTSHDIESLYEVRGTLEGLAGELFARRATEIQARELITHVDRMNTTYLNGTLESRGESKSEFYRLLLLGASNPVLECELRGIHSRIGIFRHYAFVDDKRVAISMQELHSIVNAAAVQRDPVKAKTACEEHIRLAGRLAIVEYNSRMPSELAAI